MLAAKIKHGWGYTVGIAAHDVVLSYADGQYKIDYWPDANPPTIEQIEAIELPPPAPPQSVTPAQIRLWLIANYGATVLTQIDSMIVGIPDATEREMARVKWDYGLIVLRTDPLVVQFGLALGLNESQIDAAFVAASEIA